MAYTTTAKLKQKIPYNYQTQIEGKLTQDGWITGGTLSNGGTFNESGFLQQFIDDAEDELDAYCNGPFDANGVLERIARILALYHFEQYFKAAQSDRNVGVTIYADQKQAYRLMDKINAGDILATPSGGSGANAIGLVEPDDDGSPSTLEGLEDDIIFGSVSPSDIWDES
jgi:hypothetical protein